MENVTVYGQNMLAVGYYLDKKDNQYSLLLVSHDAGSTWQTQTKLPILHDPILESVACNEQACTAIGSHTIDDEALYHIQPVILVNHHKSDRWQLITAISNKPQGWQSSVPMAIKCQLNTCTIVGEYNTQSHPEMMPMLLSSNNDMTQWSFVALNNAPSSTLNVITDNH